MNNLKKLLSLVIVCTIVFVLAGCGGEKAGSEKGLYDLSSAKAYGMTVEGDDLKELMEGEEFNIELDGKGGAIVVFSSNKSKGSYKIDGDELIFDDGDADFRARIEDDTIIIDELDEDLEMIFTKQ